MNMDDLFILVTIWFRQAQEGRFIDNPIARSKLMFPIHKLFFPFKINNRFCKSIRRGIDILQKKIIKKFRPIIKNYFRNILS